MELKPLELRAGTSINHAYFSTSLPSTSHADVLVVRFAGTSGHGCANNSDAVYMSAMIQAGLVSWSPQAVILDLQELAYEWGDLMAQTLATGAGYYAGGEDLPLAVVTSDLNIEGLTSLVTDELDSDPNTILFDSLDAAIAFLDAEYLKARR